MKDSKFLDYLKIKLAQKSHGGYVMYTKNYRRYYAYSRTRLERALESKIREGDIELLPGIWPENAQDL